MRLSTDPKVAVKFESYPADIREKLLNLRRIILETAEALESIEAIEETLKWGEPSYLVKKGSTIRINWKKKTEPTHYAMYFKCTSKLVSTFRTIYSDQFQYENNRAIVFDLEDAIPEKELRHCVALALTYHKVKHLPLLGA